MENNRAEEGSVQWQAEWEVREGLASKGSLEQTCEESEGVRVGGLTPEEALVMSPGCETQVRNH